MVSEYSPEDYLSLVCDIGYSAFAIERSGNLRSIEEQGLPALAVYDVAFVPD